MTSSTFAFYFGIEFFGRAERREIRQPKRGRGRKYVRQLKEWKPPKEPIFDRWGERLLPYGIPREFKHLPLWSDWFAVCISCPEGTEVFEEQLAELEWLLNVNFDNAEVKYQVLREIDIFLAGRL